MSLGKQALRSGVLVGAQFRESQCANEQRSYKPNDSNHCGKKPMKSLPSLRRS